MKILNYLYAILFSLGVNGCATTFKGESQYVMIATANNDSLRKTKCKAANEEGEWIGAPNIPLRIHRDGNSMTVFCQNEGQTGNTLVFPSFDGRYLAYDILWYFPVISCFVDGYNNAFYEYPTSIYVPMSTKNPSIHTNK